MRRKLNTTLGFYLPSFLRIHIETNENLQDLNTLKDNDGATYLHEYIHFIQDITTTYGLQNIERIVDYMKYVNNFVVKLPKESTFDVPIIPDSSAGNVYTNYKLNKIYDGNGDEDAAEFIDYRYCSKKVTIGSTTEDMRYIKVRYKTSKEEKFFVFGAECIVESMAWIIETECYPNNLHSSDQPPDLPYKSAEKLVELIFPEFGHDRLNILALCDASLRTFHPGDFFYQTLLHIKDKGFRVCSPEDVYKICDTVTVKYHGRKIKSDELFLEKKKEAIKQMQDYFNAPRFDSLKNWLEKMIDTAAEFRRLHPTFPLEIARNGKIPTNTSFHNFYSKVGSPLVTNNRGETTIHDPHSHSGNPVRYTSIWAIHQIYSVFWGHRQSCELVGLCCSSGVPIDMRCAHKPWQRHSELNCAFGEMWRHWGLADYTPQF